MTTQTGCAHCRNGTFPQSYFWYRVGRYFLRLKYGKRCPECARDITAAVARMVDAGAEIECVGYISKTETAMGWLLSVALFAFIVACAWKVLHEPEKPMPRPITYRNAHGIEAA